MRFGMIVLMLLFTGTNLMSQELFGTALSLDGNKNYLEVPHHERLDLEEAYTI